MSDNLDSLLDESSASKQPSDALDSILDGNAAELPEPIKQSAFAQDIVPELSSRGHQGFDQAVQIARGDLQWALKTFRGVNPDVAARVQKLARQKGVPVGLVIKNQGEFEQADEAEKLLQSLHEKDADGKFKYPNTVNWIRDPINLAKSRDDVQALKEIEGAIRTRKSKAQGELGLGEEIRRGLVRGTYQIQSSVGGLESALARTTGRSDAMGKFITRDAQKEIEANAPSESVTQGVFQPGNPAWWAARGSEIVPQILGQTALAVGSRGGSLIPSIASAMGVSGSLMAGDAYNESYEDLLNRGLSPEEANSIALQEASIVGVIGGGIEMIPGNEFLTENPAVKKVLSQAIKNRFARRGVTGFAAEGLEEFGQEVVTDLAALGLRDDSERFKDAWQRYAASFALGGVVGAGMNVATPKADDSAPKLSSEADAALQASLNKTENLNQEIRKASNDLTGLEKLEAILDKSALAKRDPDGIEAFIDQNLVAQGQPAEVEVDAQKVAEVFYQDAQTPDQIEEAKAQLNQFAQEVLISQKEMEDIILSGGTVSISKGKLLAKYRGTPMYEAIKKSAQETLQGKKEELRDLIKESQDEIKRVQRDVEPKQAQDMRSKLMLPVEEGGRGFTAQEADLSVKFLMTGLRIAATKRGQTLEEYLEQNPVELSIGEDGKAFIQRSGRSPLPAYVPPPIIEGSVRDRDQLTPEELAAIEAEHQGKRALTPEEQKILERLARQEEEKALREHVKQGAIPFREALKKSGGLPSVSALKGANDPLSGDLRIALENKKIPGLTRNDAPPLDIVRSNLEGLGYRFDTPAELLDAVSEWLRTGKDPEFSGFNSPDALFQDKKAPRGAVEFVGTKRVIHLFKDADFSTFLHESAHIFLRDMRALIDASLADDQAIKDYESVLEWAGAKNGVVTEEIEEKFASGFEAYLMEGKAPSVDLVEAFRRFRKWLVNIYRTVRGLNIEINDEIRGVFDRILASEADIMEAREYYGNHKDLSELVTKDEKARAKIRAKHQNAQETSVEALIQQRLFAYQKTLGGIKGMKDLAAQEVDAEPFYQMLSKSRKEKISLNSIKENYGEETASIIQEKFFDYVSEKGKLTVEQLALDHEFESPEALIEALTSQPSRDQAIRDRLNAILKAKEAEIANEVQGITKADEATHTDETLAALAAEAQVLQEEVEKRKVLRAAQLTDKVYRDLAREELAKMEVGRAARYDLFAKAEARHARRVIRFLREKKMAETLEARKLQLFNHAMVQESIRFRSELVKIQNRYAPKKLDSTLKGVEDAFQKPIIEALNRYGFTQRQNEPAYDLNEIKELDEDLPAMMPGFVKRGEKRAGMVEVNGKQVFRDYRQLLTVDELRDLDGFVQSIIASGRDEMLSLIEKDAMKFSEFRDKAVERIGQLKVRNVPQKGDKWLGFIPSYFPRKFWDSLTGSNIHAQFIFEIADNFQLRTTGKMGPQRKLYQLVTEADTRQLELENGFYLKAKPYFEVLTEAALRIKKEKGTNFDIEGLPLPEKAKAIGESRWTAEKAVMVMLNTGNAQNYKALEDGLAITEDKLRLISQLFEENEIKAFQGIWDLINEFHAPLDEVHFARYNRHIGKVQPKERTYIVKGGKQVKLAGGYFPLIYDSQLSDRAAILEEEDIMHKQAVIRPNKPADSFTKGRVAGKKDAPKLNLNVLYRHVSETTRYITHAKVLHDVNRLIKDPSWKSVFIDNVGNLEWKNLKDWVSKTANPNIAANFVESDVSTGLEKAVEFNRKLSTYLLLGFKISSAVVQKTGLVVAGRRIGWRWMYEGFKAFGVTGQLTTTIGVKTEAWDEITKLSRFMRTREEAIDRDAYEASQSIKRVGGWRLKLGDKTLTLKDAQNFGFKMMQWSDRGVVGPTWMGAFQKHLQTQADPKLTHEEQIQEAVKFADTIVQETQPTGLTSDRNWIQRSPNKFLRVFTMLMTWRFKYGSILFAEHRAWQQGAISTKEYVNHLAQSVLLAVILEELIRGALRAEWPDWLNVLVKLFEAPISWIPVLGNLPSTLYRGKSIDSIDKITPAGAALKEVGKELYNAKKALEKEEGAWKEVIWSGARAASVASGVPVGNAAKDINRFVENASEEE